MSYLVFMKNKNKIKNLITNLDCVCVELHGFSGIIALYLSLLSPYDYISILPIHHYFTSPLDYTLILCNRSDHFYFDTNPLGAIEIKAVFNLFPFFSNIFTHYF